MQGQDRDLRVIPRITAVRQSMGIEGFEGNDRNPRVNTAFSVELARNMSPWSGPRA